MAVNEQSTGDVRPVIIKKYPNRRLYNTVKSQYVTLDEICAMVKQRLDFEVRNAKSGEDLTRSVLTQIILEKEGKNGQNLLPVRALRQLIRFYGGNMQALVPRYLEFSIELLAREHRKLRSQMEKAFPKSSSKIIEEQTQRNMALFEKALALFDPFALLPDAKQPEQGAETLPWAYRQENPKSDEMKTLREQLSVMQKQIDALIKPGKQ
ncbi:MAG: polyhydroxyalkanoate synthesis repressor PhaR [Hyphomicrobiales bacterium]